MATVRTQEASSSLSGYAYQVFLSFRGLDTRTTFTDHLYTALVQAGVRTFRDDNELEIGENIGLELNRAIQQSRISVIVFSKNYSASRWCLNELVQILERKNTTDHTILPVFYHVDPSDVRHQTGSFAEAFVTHEERFKTEMDKVKKWKAVLKEVANLSGMHLRDGYESEFIQKIVGVIEDNLNRRIVLNVDCYLIGIDFEAKNINLWLQDESTNVSIVSICGIGGIGKTTIAKYVYNLNFQRFEGSSFLANIRETSKQFDGLVRLQKQLLSDILRRKQEEIWNADEGIIKIQNAIGCKRVFIVLDDVDHVGQLKAILGMQDWLCPGSKIIITTRHERLLKENETFKVHKVNVLTHSQSLQLFSWHAFGQDHPNEAYIKHSERVVHHCGGLPLALKVLGSSLYGESVTVWESAIKKLTAILDGEILKILQISYDSLKDDHDQRLFLDIACFFIGEEKDFTIKILDQYDHAYPESGIQNLINRCLLTIDHENKLMMHQLIREMGGEIIRQESPVECGKRSRLWRHMDSFNVLKEKTGTETIEGLILDMKMFKEDKNGEVKLETDAFARMQKLNVLHLNCVRLTGCYKEFPKKIKWLRWHGFPSTIFPSDFPSESLVALDLSYSNLKQVWKGTKFIGRLKFLNLSHCHKLAETPDFSGLPKLKSLILNGCVSLVEVHESIGKLKLVFLNLNDCKNLRKLPKSIVMLKFLEILIISGCSNLAMLPKEIKKMASARNWPTFNLFRKVKPRRSMEIFSLSYLPSSLVSLSLENCNLSDYSFPKDLSNLSKLKELSLSENPICSLPDFIKGLCSLRMLNLESCNSLQSLLGVPNITGLCVTNCTSLEKITYQSTSFKLMIVHDSDSVKKLFDMEGFFKLEPISKVDAEMINHMGLLNLKSMGDIEVKHRYKTGYGVIMKHPIQGLHEFGIFNTFVPVKEVPSWFGDKSSGPSISFIVPSLHNLKIQCLNVYSVYSSFNNLDKWFPHDGLFIKISNETKNLNWLYSPICYGFDEDDKEDMVWLSHWPFGNQLEGGDQVHISIFMGDDFQVKECGIKFVYEDDDEQEEKKRNPHNKDISSEQVIGGDLSRYLMSTGDYFLCHYFDLGNDLFDYGGGGDDNDDDDDDRDLSDYVFKTRKAFLNRFRKTGQDITEIEALELFQKNDCIVVTL